MSKESYREGDPVTASTSVTTEQISSRPMNFSNEQPLPSILLSPVSGWEWIGLYGLVAASPLFLMIGFLLRTGRNLTIPFVAGEVFVLALSITLLARYLWRRDRVHAGVAVTSALFSLVFGFVGLIGIFWSGYRDVEFSITITDKRTGKPIPNAKVSLSQDKDRIVFSQADPEGKVGITYQCRAGGTASPVCDTGGVSFGLITLKTSADGYEDTQQPLTNLVGGGLSLTDLPPPPFHLELTPVR